MDVNEDRTNYLSYLKGADATEGTVDDFKTIGECLQHFAKVKPDEEAVVFCSEDGARVAVSWKEICEKSYKMARSYLQYGVKPGECIAVVARTSPEFLYVNFGAMLSGAHVTNIAFTYSDGSDVIKMMQKIGNCSLIVLDPGLDQRNWNILKTILDEYTADGNARSSKFPYLRKLLFLSSPKKETVISVNQLLEQDHSATQLPEVDPKAIAILFQTSGSTGVPKLVAHTHASILSIRNVMKGSKMFSSEDIYFSDRPFTWGGGFPFGVLIGRKRVAVPESCTTTVDKISFVIDVIQREKCTMAGMFANMIHDLNLRNSELSSNWPLETIITGGQPVTKAVASCIGKVCKHLLISYGGTEFAFATGLSLGNPDEFEDYANGMPLPGIEVKVVDTSETTVPRNERGELYIRTPCMFNGYLNDNDQTKTVKTADDWYKTDDIGRIDDDGCVYVEGRISDMIISGAMNVSPAILESALKLFPGVQSAVVVPVSDDVLYQVVCACVCVKGGSGVTETQIRHFMDEIHNDKERLYTVLPKFYMFHDQFPEEGNGKVSRSRLKEMAEQMFH